MDPEDLYIVEPLKFSPEKKVLCCGEGAGGAEVFLLAGGAHLSCSPCWFLGLAWMLCLTSRTSLFLFSLVVSEEALQVQK